MDIPHAVFRRLAERDAIRFRPLCKHPAWKIILIIAVIIICVQWVTH